MWSRARLPFHSVWCLFLNRFFPRYYRSDKYHILVPPRKVIFLCYILGIRMLKPCHFSVFQRELSSQDCMYSKPTFSQAVLYPVRGYSLELLDISLLVEACFLHGGIRRLWGQSELEAPIPMHKSEKVRQHWGLMWLKGITVCVGGCYNPIFVTFPFVQGKKLPKIKRSQSIFLGTVVVSSACLVVSSNPMVSSSNWTLELLREVFSLVFVFILIQMSELHPDQWMHVFEEGFEGTKQL